MQIVENLINLRKKMLITRRDSFALNKELEKHYIGVMGAVHIGILHEYQFVVLPESSKKLLEVYSYEWN